MIEKLKEINNKIIDSSKFDEELLKKHKLIKEILEDKDCFLKIPIEDAYAILRDLGINEQNLKQIYTELIDIA